MAMATGYCNDNSYKLISRLLPISSYEVITLRLKAALLYVIIFFPFI